MFAFIYFSEALSVICSVSLVISIHCMLDKLNLLYIFLPKNYLCIKNTHNFIANNNLLKAILILS